MRKADGFVIISPEWAGMVPPGAGERDAWLRRRIEFADRILLDYAKALAPIRSSGLTEHADFPYGM